jgi:putative spermidine/putrescine transport system permease protein
MTEQRNRNGYLLIPAIILVGGFFLIPLTYLFIYSFYQYSATQLMVRSFTLENYGHFFRDPTYRSLLWKTLSIAFWVTVACVVFGYPVAYQFARSKTKWRGLLMIMIVSPLFISPVIRTYGLQLILSDGGLINQLLKWSGLRQEPIRLLFTDGAVIFSLAIVNLSFMILSLSSVIRAINPSLEEAAQNLGANPVTTFLRVTLPLSLPGLLAGSILVFINGIGAYATPLLIGGTKVHMMVVDIYEQFSAVGNWPYGAAMSFILLLTALLLLAAYTMLLRRSVSPAKGGR